MAEPSTAAADLLAGPERIARALGSVRHGAPFVDVTDMRLLEAASGHIAVSVPLDGWISSSAGGVLPTAACAADSALVYSVMSALPVDRTSSTIRLGVQLLAGGPARAELVSASATVVEIVGDKAVSRADIVDEAGRCLGHASARTQVLARSVEAEQRAWQRAPTVRREPGPAGRLDPADPGGAATKRYRFGSVADLANAVGVMHGGAIAVLLVESAVMTARQQSAMGSAARAVDLDIVFVRPAPVDSSDGWLDCNLLQAGKRSTVIESALWSGGQPCAHARVGFIRSEP